MARLVVRIELDSDARVGAEYIRLLELVDSTGSITGAGRAHGITYRRAWTLLDELNRMFKAPVMEAQSGGPQGGGARLTDFGREIIGRYRAIEAVAAQVTAQELAALEAVARPDPPQPR